jgi:hypothetical protein
MQPVYSIVWKSAAGRFFAKLGLFLTPVQADFGYLFHLRFKLLLNGKDFNLSGCNICKNMLCCAL